MKKITSLKPGDVVTYYTEYSSHAEGNQTLVGKIGRQYITTTEGKRFNKENGHGEYGQVLFAGTKEEYEAWAALAPTRMKQRAKIEFMIKSKTLDVPELTKIINFIQRLENETE